MGKTLQAGQEKKNPAGIGLRAAPRGGRPASKVAKERFLKVLGDGSTVLEALKHVGRTENTYPYWRRTDPSFKESADHILGLRFRKGKERKPVPDFPTFCETYLSLRLFWHQLQWFDILENREPRDLHPAQKWQLGADPNLLLFNVPPAHAKSTTVTAAYVLWRILSNPITQVVIVGKNETMAKKWMTQVQGWLTSPLYRDLQMDFGPEGGFEKTSTRWTTTQIYFGYELRPEAEKDPTLEVLGMGGTIYGARADLIVLDDVIENSNAHDYDNQISWITGMILTRPSDEDKVLVVGTRVAPVDLYKELLNPTRYEDEISPWSLFMSPAVLEFADDPADWVTLWPKSHVPKRGKIAKPGPDGLYVKWDGPSLARMRKRLSTDPYAWSLKYQQEDVSLNTIFPREDVFGCVDSRRQAGPLVAGAPGHPTDGMAGMYVIAGFDPASEGFSAATVVAFDRRAKKRWVLNVHNQPNMQPHEVRELLIGWAKQYGVKEWRVEKVLLSTWIMQDREIVQDLANLGCSIQPHQTTPGTKWDADAGVMAMSGLFKQWRTGHNLISIPNIRGNEAVRALCEQLANYFPKTKGTTDTLMALWFVNSRCLALLLEEESDDQFVESEFNTRRDLALRQVVDFGSVEDEADLQLLDWFA